MFTCNRHETKHIMEGRAIGFTRKYDQCPYQTGDELVLTSKFIDASGAGRSIPFARVSVVSIRPGTVGQFRRDQMIAEMDGYPNGEVWFGQMSQMYKGMTDTDGMTHIKFRMIQLDRDAGRRPDVEMDGTGEEKISID